MASRANELMQEGAIRIGLGLLWALHWLPLPVLAAFARGLGGGDQLVGRARVQHLNAP